MFKKSFKRFLSIDYDRILSEDSSEDENPRGGGGGGKVAKLETSSRGEGKGDASFPRRNSKEDAGNDFPDFSKYVQASASNFAKRQEKKKEMVVRFVERVVDVYQRKFGDVFRKQGEEVDKFKKDFLREVTAELDDWKKQLMAAKEKEREVLRLLDELKAVYNASETQNRRVQTIAEMHGNFIQRYDALIEKHKSEAQAVKQVVEEEVSSEKAKILSSLREEEEEKGFAGESHKSSYFNKMKYN